MARRRIAGQRGLSLAEMLVALALVSLMLLAATWLLIRASKEAQRQAGREPTVGGPTEVALDGLERDLREAAELPATEGPWRKDPSTLIVRSTSGAFAVWHLDDESLIVERREADATEWTRRRMLSEVDVCGLTLRSRHLFDLALRRRGEKIRSRTVLLRNVGRDGAPLTLTSAGP